MPEYNVSSNEDLELAISIVEPGDTIKGDAAALPVEGDSPEADPKQAK